METSISRFALLVLVTVGLIGCSPQDEVKNYTPSPLNNVAIASKNAGAVKAISFEDYDKTPSEWGENVTGVRTTFETDEQEIALTFDACGGSFGNEVDEELLAFLREENIPATLFINERWLLENEQLFIELSEDPLFQLENHGTAHVPLSVEGKEAWGIPGTTSPEEVYEEVMRQHETVRETIGKEMTLFRSGTAYYDEVAVEIAQDLGYEVVNFSVLGDAGATYSSKQVEEALMTATNGSIVLLHMNQPTSGTAEGVKRAIPQLLQDGFSFVLLRDQVLE